ncbi:L-histidine N(alpha)-methyltransferase [Saccharicrinis sp. FJH62]|uniref:L-histidine N(alpha)-methyltransferase n=1 Tax=Saccharicrinis sp. FJH62 TaxID=3344657 RepID=UPI0035D42A48
MNNSDIAIQVNPHLTISNYLSTENESDVLHEILDGLKAEQKYISSRFFYDEKGSALFEEITSLPEYYPTKTETAILKANATNIPGHYTNIDIIELGSGDCTKISVLLDAVQKNRMKHINYIPVDVSEAAVLKSADILSLKYPGLTIHGLLADFLKHLDQLPGEQKRLICFFGSTLGNLDRKQATNFLMNLKRIMNPGDQLILGLDMVKNISILHKAYNDSQEITARFNKNILNVINEIIQTDFDTRNFEHYAFYNEQEARIEMHLKAAKNMRISSPLFDEKIDIKAGETIHTENSHKFTLADIRKFETLTGLKIQNIYTDKEQWFSLVSFIHI